MYGYFDQTVAGSYPNNHNLFARQDHEVDLVNIQMKEVDNLPGTRLVVVNYINTPTISELSTLIARLSRIIDNELEITAASRRRHLVVVNLPDEIDFQFGGIFTSGLASKLQKLNKGSELDFIVNGKGLSINTKYKLAVFANGAINAGFIAVSDMDKVNDVFAQYQPGYALDENFNAVQVVLQ